MTAAMDARRLAELKNKLKARTKPDGSAAKGYTRNVNAIRAEIAKIERRQAALTKPTAVA